MKEFIPFILHFTLSILNPVVYRFRYCLIRCSFAEKIVKVERNHACLKLPGCILSFLKQVNINHFLIMKLVSLFLAALGALLYLEGKAQHFFQIIAYKSVYGITYTISLLPMTLLYAIASFAYFFAYYIVGYRKAVVIQNMARSFPDKRYGEIRCITKKFYTCFVAYFAEITKNISVSVGVLEKRVIFENLEIIDRHVNAGRNVIACLGHCGNWEMLNFMPYKLCHDMYAVYKPLRSGIMNRLMIKVRSRFGMKLIPDKSVIRHILTQKTSPSVYLFLSDQCPQIKEDKYKFDLLNQETYVFSGMEKLARISRSAVVYLHITRLSKGNYRITCIPVCSEAESMNEREITQKYVDLLVENIREEPYGWLWTHKRWKR